jgi:integrase
MAIKPVKKEIAPGIFETTFTVVVDTVNTFSGKRIQKRKRNVPNFVQAQRLYREMWVMCRNSKPEKFNLTHWGQLLKSYLDQIDERERSSKNPMGLSPRVIKTKHSSLRHTRPWSSIHLDLFTPQFVWDNLDELEKQGMSRGLSNHVLKEIKCVFSYGLHCGAIKHNPFAGIKLRRVPKKRKEALTHEDVNFLLSEAKKRNHSYYYIWLLTISLGLRRSELAGLQWIDVEFNQGLLYVRRQNIPGEGVVDFLKDREERVVAIPTFLISVLKELKLQSQSDFVIDVKCRRWKDGQQAQVIREFCREIGLKEVTHHQLRATHITLALVDGVPLGIVKENVGHAKLSTTDIYFRSAGINMRGQMDGLNIKVPLDNEAKLLPLKVLK